MKKKCFLLIAGGTGGHVFPAIALAEYLKSQDDSVILMTDNRGLAFINNTDRKLFDHIHTLSTTHFRGSHLEKLKAFYLFMREAFMLKRHFQSSKPHAALGFGGFLSFWPIVWSWLLNIPAALYQSDAIIGRANKILTRITPLTFTAFQKTKGLTTPTQWVGFLNRASFQHSPYPERNPHTPLNILAIGGSQGAGFLSEILPKAFKLLPALMQEKITLVQQCRSEKLDETRQNYSQTNIAFTLKTFIQDIHTEIEKAHLVITRAGASTMGELAQIGRPALFIPYPYATFNHQWENAIQATSLKGGWMKTEAHLTSSFLAHLLKDIFEHPKKLENCAHHIQKLTQPHPALLVRQHLCALIAQKKG